jgi:hypothetical protein
MTFEYIFVRAGGDDDSDFWSAVTCHRFGIAFRTIDVGLKFGRLFFWE